MLKDLSERSSTPPDAHHPAPVQRLCPCTGQPSQGRSLQRQLSDLVSLVRFALGLDTELKPFADEVDKRFQAWIWRHNAQHGTAFSPEQTEWLRLMKDHTANSCQISRDDSDDAQLADMGGLQKACGIFGSDLDALMGEMNEVLVA